MSGNQNGQHGQHDQRHRDRRLDVHFLVNPASQARASSPAGSSTGAPSSRATASSTPNPAGPTAETSRTSAMASMTAVHPQNIGGKHSNWHKVMGNVQKCDFCEKRSPEGYLFGCYGCSLQICPDCARLGKVYAATKPHTIDLAGLGLIEPQVRPLVRPGSSAADSSVTGSATTDGSAANFSATSTDKPGVHPSAAPVPAVAAETYFIGGPGSLHSEVKTAGSRGSRTSAEK